MSRQMFRVALAALAAGVVLGHGPALRGGCREGQGRLHDSTAAGSATARKGQGSAITSLGKVLAPDPMPLETFVAFVRSTDRAMPPYSEKVLPNEDLADMHAYLASIPKPKDYKSIPLLSQ